MADCKAFIDDLSERLELERPKDTPVSIYVRGMPAPITHVTAIGLDDQVAVVMSDDQGVFYIKPDAIVGMCVFDRG